MWLITIIALVLGSFSTEAIPTPKNDLVRDNISYLLPDNIDPISYVLEIDVSGSFPANKEPKTFNGKVDIKVEIKNPTNEIILHASGMNISLLQVDGQIVNSYSKNETEEFLIIQLDQTINAGKISIYIQYTGTLYTDMHGFYVSSYTENDNKDKKYVLTTQFQPTHARRAFPCFDEPKYKATFDVSIKLPLNNKYTAISNMKQKLGTSPPDVKFETTQKMSTYLLAFIVSEFSKREEENSDYKVWARPEAYEQTKVAFEVMPEIIQQLDSFTGIPYKLFMPKMDMAALPDFSAGAMENWGLLTYRETALLVDDQKSTDRDLQRVVTVIAHEIAHQWFGNLVTLTWWNNTWMNEGFARYFEYHTTAKVKKDWEMENQFVIEQQQSIFDVDALEKTTPLTLEVYTPSDIQSHFGTISYSKGGSVIRMLEHFMRHEAFKSCLNKYLMANKFKSVVPKNLWDVFENYVIDYNLPIDYAIRKIMSTWISQPGYPLITVNVMNNQATFSQKRFLSNPLSNKKTEELWYVPISYTTSSKPNFEETFPKLWLTPTESSKIVVDLKNPTWLIANIKQSGYYRVNYNDENWLALAKALKIKEERDKIDKINRAQIIDDVMNLARAGIVSYNIAFDVTDYLKTETDYFPWYSSFRVFKFLLQRYSEKDETGKLLRTYLLELMEQLLKDKSFTSTPKKQIDIFNYVNALEWASTLEHEKTIKEAVDLFGKNLAGVNKNFKSIVQCTAVKYSKDEHEWAELWTIFEKSNVAAEKVALINALGCSRNKATLNKYLLKSIDGTSIRKQDASAVFTAVYTSSSVGVDVALEFLKTKFDDIVKSYESMNALDKLILGIAGRLTDTSQINTLKEIVAKKEIIETTKQAALETAEQNKNWATKYGASIKDILENRNRNSASSFVINKFTLVFSISFISIYVTKFAS